jgi:hypothetical protein
LKIDTSAEGSPRIASLSGGVAMTDRMQYSETDPRHHTAKLKGMLSQVIDYVRKDVGKVTDPKAQALFETTAEVLLGLRKAYDFEQGSEPAWRTAS